MNTHAGRLLRILLSAYACEPGKGSEPGVGWNWALALARRGHDVWVLTRSNNHEAIELECARLDAAIHQRLHFLYHDLPRWASWWKRGGRGVHLYYFLWQWGAYRLARREHAAHGFDCVHHVTFVSARQPSFMGGLGIPFIFGPVAGGERAPWRLRTGYGWRGGLLDALRDLANLLIKFDPLMRRTFRQAERIYVTSAQTQRLVPRRHLARTQVRLAIALAEAQAPPPAREAPARPLKLMYIGRFLYWKGMHLGLPAFARFLRHHPGARLSMIGQGPDEHRWRRLARRLGIEGSIDWIPWVSQDKLTQVYRDHDALLFPSLHDSGGMVVLEAMQHGLPAVCLKLGGPGVLVDETCGRAIDVSGLDEEAVTARLADALTKLSNAPEWRLRLREGAINKARASTWEALANRIYTPIERDLALKS